MRRIMIVFGAVLILFGGQNWVYGADVAKIGIVDVRRLLDISTAGQAAVAEIKTRHEEMEAILQKKGVEIEELNKALEARAKVMNRETREEKERELRIKTYDVKTLQKKYMEELKEIERQLVGRIKQKTLNFVRELGKKEGFLLVLEKTEAGIMYAPNEIDLTDRLIQLYNAEFEKETKKE